MYKVVITSRAERELRRLDKAVKIRIVSAILALAENPRPHGCLKVKGEDLGGFVLETGALVTGSMIKPASSM